MTQLKGFSPRPVIIFAQSNEANEVENEDVVGAAPMPQLHLSDQQFYCLLMCVLYWRLDGISNHFG